MKRETVETIVVALIVFVVLITTGGIAYLRYSQCRQDGYNATVCTSLISGRAVVLEER